MTRRGMEIFVEGMYSRCWMLDAGEKEGAMERGSNHCRIGECSDVCGSDLFKLLYNAGEGM